MHLDLTFLTALAVFVHLGTTLAGSFLRDNTDRKKLAAIDTKTDAVLTTMTALAPAVNSLPAAPPKTIAQVAGDLASVAQALAALSQTSSAPPTPGGSSNAG